MPVEVPLTPAGERVVSVNVGPDVFTFRTYYVLGADRHWLLDIQNGQDQHLISGINLVPGVGNLLKGMGDTLEDYQLYLHVEHGSEKDEEAPGKTFFLVWFNPGEENPFTPRDPMETIGSDLW